MCIYSYLFSLYQVQGLRPPSDNSIAVNSNNNNNIPGNHEVKELQKTAILGTAHILRKVLM